ncbi:hypothetical protein CDD80_5171 [Ophiocordyceps camponoti-rufipedis]|uniref:Ureidoglycolate hydrolase n=1 Tax=Ophiocordyceps camponoti-rufipedis TaxID=2004952 RepID=A0A2C5ZNU1_9HYPO|nr:hypothetical protein CDD80_5171 [Ophiocordyceps camponoti-rufipedis]
MASTLKMQLRASERQTITAEPLNRSTFAPYGTVVENPCPGIHPASTAAASLPSNASPANDGTAIQYRDVSPVTNLYQGSSAKPRMSIFACATHDANTSPLAIPALERHPFTTQTFIPISSAATTYLVVVCPCQSPQKGDDDGVRLPRWRGMPDLRGLRAFVASASQAVTYAAGTWHAPMMALGSHGQRLDFVVVQFASGVADEDCQLAKIQHLYARFRAEHAAQSRQALLSPGYSGLLIDEYLVNLERRPGFRDGRHCLVFWARPPIHTLRLAEELQRRLRLVAPNAWMMPTYRMHLTTLEMAFSKTADEIAALVARVRPEAERIASYTYSHRARLVKPAVAYDLKGFAVSWVTAAGETVATSNEDGHVDDAFTYHHLRRDVYDLVQGTGVEVASRYQVPGAHVTLGRFLDDEDHDTVEKRQTWAAAVDDINRWLEAEVWGTPDGEWIVGQEKGLDFRAGTLWYGGGRTIVMGEGF